MVAGSDGEGCVYGNGRGNDEGGSSSSDVGDEADPKVAIKERRIIESLVQQ